MTVRTETNRFQNSHGSMPKGFGSWFFEINGKIFIFTATFSDAKKQAIAKAKEVGAFAVIVMP